VGAVGILHYQCVQIYNGKFDVLSFVIKSGRNLTICVKFEVNFNK
jgi:hypothetical protein